MDVSRSEYECNFGLMESKKSEIDPDTDVTLSNVEPLPNDFDSWHSEPEYSVLLWGRSELMREFSPSDSSP